MTRAIVAIVIFLVACTGCAKPPVEIVMSWPAPPEEPRVAFIKTYIGEGDFATAQFFDFIFGRPASPPMDKPYGVAARNGKIYVALTGAASVMVIDLKAQAVSYLGGAGSTAIGSPAGIAIARDGTIFVSDSKQGRVFGFSPEGKLNIAIGAKNEFRTPAGMAINHELGRLYIVDSYDHNVRVYSLRGEALFTIGKRGTEAAEFNYPTNIAVNQRNGNVYVTDTQNFRIQAFDKDGKFLRKFGEVGDRPGFFSRPKGIGVDSDGHIYVFDSAFANFQIFDEQGQILLFIGSHGYGPGKFLLPAGLYVDEMDRIYVTDQVGAKVEVYQYMSEKWKKDNPAEYKKYLLGGEASPVAGK